jgi:hypothetical protein
MMTDQVIVHQQGVMMTQKALTGQVILHQDMIVPEVQVAQAIHHHPPGAIAPHQGVTGLQGAVAPVHLLLQEEGGNSVRYNSSLIARLLSGYVRSAAFQTIET